MLTTLLIVLCVVGAVTSNCPLQPTVYISYNDTIMSLSELKVICEQTTYENNTNCCSCDNNTRVCNNLESALHHVTSLPLETSIQITLGNKGTITYTMTSLPQLKSKHVIFYGYGDTIIQCINTGIAFIGIRRLELYHLTWQSCGYIYIENKYSPFSGIVIANCQSILLHDVHVIDSPNTGCFIDITRQDTFYNYTIEYSSFENNGPGSGLSIQLQENTPSTFIFRNTLFYNNTGDFGGGVTVTTQNLPTSNGCGNLIPNIQFIDCNFTENNAKYHGGGVYLLAQSSLYNATFTGCYITSNTASRSGGGAYFEINDDVATCNVDVQIGFYNCFWMFNKAPISSVISFKNTQFLQASVHFFKNLWLNNSVFRQSFGGETFCLSYFEDVVVIFENSNITFNNGSGICVQSSKLEIRETILFERNAGFKGGGIYLSDNAWISLSQMSHVIFTENMAVYGAGIYQSSIVNSTLCFLEVDYTNTNYPLPRFTFNDNRVLISGQSIYFGDPTQQCVTEMDNVSITYSPKDSPVQEITSTATTIIFSDPIINDHIELILGQYLVLNATITDLFHNATTALINVFILPQGESIFGNTSYTLSGFTSFTIESGINNPNIYIEGPIVNTKDTKYVLKIAQAEQSNDFQKTIKLTINKCPLGFKHSTNKCICASEDLMCNFTSGKACITKSYWHGLVKGKQITVPCTSAKCKNIENCIDCSSTGYCKLPQQESDQCFDNRAGVLCTECLPNYSYTFGAINCVPVTTCENGKFIIIAIVMILFILILLLLLFVLLKLGKHIKVGYLFSFIYYFSIINFILIPNYVSNEKRIMVSLFESITQLNPHFLGYIPICLAPKSTILEQQMILYVGPLLVSTIVLSILCLSKCCPRYLTFRDNTTVRAISLLVLLSFTDLAVASFNILNPIKFKGVETVFVNIQPSTEYFALKEHLPWFIFSAFVEFGLVLPFTFFLLFAPLLIRCCNLNKIKPFLDEFQGCYKDKYRWMAGYYFLCRQLYLVASIAPSSTNTSLQYAYQITSLFVFIIHAVLQPYNSKWLNVVDTILLADLLCITVSYGITANTVYDNLKYGHQLQQGVTYVLILIPVFYALGGLILAIGYELPSKYKERIQKIFKFKTRKFANTLLEPLVPTSTGVQTLNVCLEEEQGFREPILGLLDSYTPEEPSPVIQHREQALFHRESLAGSTIIERPRRVSYCQEWQENLNESTAAEEDGNKL